MTVFVVGVVIIGGLFAGFALERLAHRARAFGNLGEYSEHRRQRDSVDDAGDVS